MSGRRLAGAVLNFILPSRCVLCGIVIPQDAHQCHLCWPKISFITGDICHCCGMPFDVSDSFEPESGPKGEGDLKDDLSCARCLKDPPSFAQARACLYYEGEVKDLILKFKHGDMTHLTRAFVSWMSDHHNKLIMQSYYRDIDLVVPVPLHPRRLLKRKYNQAALLAKGLAQIHHRTYFPDLVVRNRATASQGHKSIVERHLNVKGAFGIKAKNLTLLRDKKIMLIDDVYTSGATVNSISTCLLDAGASDVKIHTLAKVVS